jgi:hypothetical protein
MTSYPDRRNPRHTRSLLHNAHDRYIQGVDKFPRLRVNPDRIDEFPRKTIPIAAKLAYEWAVIDQDRDYFDASVVSSVDTLLGRESDDDKRAAVIIRIGQNMVNLADISVVGQQPSVTITPMWRQEFVDMIRDQELQMIDGTTVRYEDGKMVGDFKGIIGRHGNVSGVAGLSAGETVRLMQGVTGEPPEAVTGDNL